MNIQNRAQPASASANTNTTFPPELQLMKPQQVCRLIGVSRRTLQDMVQRGEWPQPLRLTAKTIRWRLADVEAALTAAGGEGAEQ